MYNYVTTYLTLVMDLFLDKPRALLNLANEKPTFPEVVACFSPRKTKPIQRTVIIYVDANVWFKQRTLIRF